MNGAYSLDLDALRDEILDRWLPPELRRRNHGPFRYEPEDSGIDLSECFPGPDCAAIAKQLQEALVDDYPGIVIAVSAIDRRRLEIKVTLPNENMAFSVTL